MARHKPKTPGSQPPTAYCAFHDRLMNDQYIRKRRCTLRGNSGPCKHLQWLSGQTNEKGGEENAQSIPD